jgi:nitrogen fixation/metabolism regulation signal transduction histidine kinase
MRNPLRTGGFEKRLLVFFLLLSVMPTLLIAFFGARYFVRSVELVSNPALSQSFQNSMEIARQLSMRLESDAMNTSLHLADEFGIGPAVDTGRIEVFLKSATEKYGVDFAALYTRRGTSWMLAATYPAPGDRLDREIESTATPAADPGPYRIALSDEDVIASAVPHGTDSLFVAGFLLDTGMMDMMRRTGEDLSRYRSVRLYVSIWRRYMIAMISALVVIMAASSAIVSRLIAKRISHPIKELAHATERIAQGDLDHRVSVVAKDEIMSLVTSFNNMTQELQENKRNLIRAQRIAAWRDVARRIAHEIKNPLTPIEIAIYRMKKRLAGDGKDRQVIEESLDSILKEVGVLKTIAQEFSAFAKLPEPKLAKLNVNEALQSVLGLYSSSFKAIEVRTSYDGELPDVMADGDQIRRVFGNLIKNAVEAMPTGGRLRIATRPGRHGPASAARLARIEIADTGPGIPEEIREKIFDPYFTTKQSGTGLGLAMAYRIIEDHGGTIRFSSTGEGTTFMIELRLAPDADEEAA